VSAPEREPWEEGEAAVNACLRDLGQYLRWYFADRYGDKPPECIQWSIDDAYRLCDELRATLAAEHARYLAEDVAAEAGHA